jgi:glycerophosphoryl diester phosphodiesterase
MENTLPGFLLALEHGADAVELDTHVTSDGVVVVHHDDVIHRRAIARTAWRELEEMDLGSGARIPRLQDVLDAIADRATVYIELKGAAIEDTVVAVARQHGRHCALHSFDHEAIARVARRAPDIPRGLLFDKNTKQAVRSMRTAVERIRPRDVWPHWSLVNSAFMEAASELQVRVIPWTVNSLNTARSLASAGVAGICTDDVRLLAQL